MEGIRRWTGQRRADELLRRRTSVRHDRGGQLALCIRAATGAMMTRLLGTFVIVSLAAIAVSAQAPAYKVSRTPDGQPDLQGFWSNATYTPLERPDSVTKEFYTPAEAAAAEKAAAAR